MAGPAVWRDVDKALLRSGRGGFLGPDTWRRTRWWELELSCGHREERNVLYRKTSPPLPKGTRRDAGDVLPAPKRVRCMTCTREVLRENLQSLDSSQDIR